MQILNPQFHSDTQAGKPVSISLGSGGKVRNGYYGLDLLPLPGVDIVADLNQPLDQIADDSVGRIHSNHALEHVAEFLPLMRELHRVCRHDAEITICVPHFSNVYGFSDPTHVRFFGLYTMYYFVAPELQPKRRRVPAFYSDTRFMVESIRIEFYRKGLIDKVFASFIERLVNRSLGWQDFYERRLAGLFHARQITYRLKPVKPA